METRIVDRVWRGGETLGKYSYRISESCFLWDEMTDLPAKISKQLSLKSFCHHDVQVARESIDEGEVKYIHGIYRRFYGQEYRYPLELQKA